MKKANSFVFIASCVAVGIIFVGFGIFGQHTPVVVPVTLTALQTQELLLEYTSEFYNWTLLNYPEYQTFYETGLPPPSVTNYSIEAITARNEFVVEMLNNVLQLNPALLGQEDQITYSMFSTNLNNTIQSFLFQEYLLFMNQLQGPQLELPQFPNYMSLSLLSDYQAYVAWLQMIPAQIDQQNELLQLAVEQGIVFPTVILPAVAGQIQRLCSPQGTSPFLTPLLNAQINSTLLSSLVATATSVVNNLISPAFCRLSSTWNNIYIPATSTDISASDRMGSAYYEFCMFRETTLASSPQSINNLGLKEVTRILVKMQGLMGNFGNFSSVSDTNNYMRTAPQFYFTSESDYLTATRDICKRADAALPFLFNELPRCPYGVDPIPAASAPVAPAAYYNSPDVACSRPGIYSVNTYNLAARPSYTMQSTALHETVPGHHLQIALALENTNLPAFRRQSDVTAYVEGWALYAETLGFDMGFYTDAASNYGHLADEMFRACRLVVDTGIHALGWSRSQAISFMAANTPLSIADITAEVDRYIAWPGQALAYKSGALTIQRLKSAAQQLLGANFSIKNFHTSVLKHGAIPLNILINVVSQDFGITTPIIL